MSAWSVGIAFVLNHEGGYANVADDRGGETYRGISRRYHGDWLGWATVDAAKPLKWNAILPELENLVRDFYYDEMWIKVRGQEIPGPLAIALFDFAVLSSPERAVRAMQLELGVQPALGNFREVTMEAVRKVSGTYVDLAKRVTMRRGQVYEDLCKRDASQVQFLSTWIERLVDLAVTFATLPG